MDAVGTEIDVDPRIERTRRLVLDATIDLIAEHGYGAVTIESVAARSGVAKSTIYRHWPGRFELLNDAFHQLKPPPPLNADGSIRDRIVALLEHMAITVTTGAWSACLTALIDAAEREPEAYRLRCELSQAGRQTVVDLLEEGVRTGELPAGLDARLVADALGGPILMRRLMSPEPFDPADVRHLVDQILGPEKPPTRRTRPSGRGRQAPL